jgi:hypothetical protein
MKNVVILFLVFSIVSCNIEKKEKQKEVKIVETVSTVDNMKDSAPQKKASAKTNRETVKIISVEEQLVMPADYLTDAMYVVNDKMDTLVFLDSYEFQSQVGDSITIEYEFKESRRLLICFNCKEYTDNVELYDISATASAVGFTSLKLVEYIEDEYLIPASEFIMIDSNGQKSTFFSNNDKLISDSVLMKSDFYTYGYSIVSAPHLLNRAELLKK